jgi:Holliday junction resolvasome RuvABC DNA-binding subunit
MEEKKVVEALLNYGFSRKYIKKLIRKEWKRRRTALAERRKELKESAIKTLLHDMY